MVERLRTSYCWIECMVLRAKGGRVVGGGSTLGGMRGLFFGDLKL